MAILQVSCELIEKHPDSLGLLENYFDSIKELSIDKAFQLVNFEVQGDGLPKDNTRVYVYLASNSEEGVYVDEVTTDPPKPLGEY